MKSLKKFGANPVLWGMVALACLFLGWILVGPDRIGNDYQAFQVSQAMNFRFYQKMGVEPLWHPHITGGIPILGAALLQAFYLPAWITSHLPGYWSGNALDWFVRKKSNILNAKPFS